MVAPTYRRRILIGSVGSIHWEIESRLKHSACARAQTTRGVREGDETGGEGGREDGWDQPLESSPRTRARCRRTRRHTRQPVHSSHAPAIHAAMLHGAAARYAKPRPHQLISARQTTQRRQHVYLTPCPPVPLAPPSARALPCRRRSVRSPSMPPAPRSAAGPPGTRGCAPPGR